MPATDFIDSILECSDKVLVKKVKIASFNGPYTFYVPLNFLNFLFLKFYNFSMTVQLKYVLHHTIATWDVIFLGMQTHPRFQKTHFCEINIYWS